MCSKVKVKQTKQGNHRQQTSPQCHMDDLNQALYPTSNYTEFMPRMGTACHPYKSTRFLPIGPTVWKYDKLEVHNVSQCRQRRSEPWPQATWTKTWWTSATRFLSYASGQTDTNRRTDILIPGPGTVTLQPYQGEVSIDQKLWSLWERVIYLFLINFSYFPKFFEIMNMHVIPGGREGLSLQYFLDVLKF